MKLKVGSIFPEFNLKDDSGISFSLSKDFTNKYIVLYFYPKDETPGCTKQACYFRDFHGEFKNLNCEIIGISNDGRSDHEKFKRKYQLPFKLLTDEKGKLRSKLSLPKDFLGLSPGRITFLLNSKHEILFIFRSSLNMKKHILATLKFLNSII